MAPFLRRFASFTIRRFCGSTGPVFRAVWLAGLVLATLSSCSRAAYVFSPGPRAYLDAERAAPSVPAAQAEAGTDSLPAGASQRPHVPARRLAPKLRPSAARRAGSGRPARARALAAKLAAKRLARLAAAPHAPRNTTALGGGIGAFGSLGTGIALIVGGLLALLIGIGISTNVIGAIFGLLFIVAGSILLAIGLVLLIIALIARA